MKASLRLLAYFSLALMLRGSLQTAAHKQKPPRNGYITRNKQTTPQPTSQEVARFKHYQPKDESIPMETLKDTTPTTTNTQTTMPSALIADKNNNAAHCNKCTECSDSSSHQDWMTQMMNQVTALWQAIKTKLGM